MACVSFKIQINILDLRESITNKKQFPHLVFVRRYTFNTTEPHTHTHIAYKFVLKATSSVVVSRSLGAINTRSNLNKFQRAHIFGCIPDRGAASEISFRERAADTYAAGVIDACERCGRILCSNVCVCIYFYCRFQPTRRVSLHLLPWSFCQLEVQLSRSL